MFCLLLAICCDKNLYKFNKVQASNEKPFYVLKNEDGIINFYESKVEPSHKKIQLHTPFLIQKIRNMKEPIELVTTNKKYVIRPFKDITMVEDDQSICLGKYKGSFLMDGTYQQEFDCGDACDLREGRARTSSVVFKAMMGDLKVHKFYEKRLCEYMFHVGGQELAREFENCVEINYSQTTEDS